MTGVELMCLAIPGRVKAISEDMAVIDYDGLLKQSSTRLFPQAKVGDIALVHAGFIIQILSEEEGQELLVLNKEVVANINDIVE